MLPYQFNVGVAGGAQCVGHAVKAGFLAHPEQVDFTNTLNLLCHASMLRAVRKRATGLANLVASIYCKHSELLVRGATASSPHPVTDWGTTGGLSRRPVLQAHSAGSPGSVEGTLS